MIWHVWPGYLGETSDLTIYFSLEIMENKDKNWDKNQWDKLGVLRDEEPYYEPSITVRGEEREDGSRPQITEKLFKCIKCLNVISGPVWVIIKSFISLSEIINKCATLFIFRDDWPSLAWPGLDNEKVCFKPNKYYLYFSAAGLLIIKQSGVRVRCERVRFEVLVRWWGISEMVRY